MGLLKATGTIDLGQFWPGGTLAVTHAFENANVVGNGKKQPIEKKGRITIRLQDIV